MAIKLMTDSTSYIPANLIERYGISIMPLNVNFEDKSFVDVPRDFDAFYKELKLVDYIPKSSQPPFAMLYDTFEQFAKNGDEVIAVFLSSKMSGTFSTASIIKNQILEDYPNAKITIIDSKSNCMQLGRCVLSGAEAIEDGASYDEAVAKIVATIPRTRFIFSPDTLEYLRRGGRIGNAEAFVGQVLKVKPILTVADGMTTSLGKVRTRKKAIGFMRAIFDADVARCGLKSVVIHHIEAYDEAEKLGMALQETYEIDAIEIISIGPVIGTHVGPGAIGIVYETHNELT